MFFPRRGMKLLSTFIALLLSTVAHAQLDIHPGEKLVIEFGFSAPPTASGQPLDLLRFSAGGSFNDFNGSLTFNLYDGSTLLGTATTTDHVTTWQFAPSTGDWINTHTTVIDFTSINAGTIQGRFELIPTFINPVSSTSVSPSSYDIITGDAIGTGMYNPGSAATNVSAYVTAIPEPGTAGLLLSLAAALVAAVHARRQRTPRPERT
jgi:hypothetical protein